MPCPVGYGLKQSKNNELEINWVSQPPAPKDVLELLASHCSGACWQNQCHCLQNSLPCTDACHLLHCENQSTFHQINEDAGNECDYDDNKQKLGQLKVSLCESFYYIFIFEYLLCILYSIKSVSSLIRMFKLCHVTTHILSLFNNSITTSGFLYISIVFFWVSLNMLMIFSNFSLILWLKYAENNRIYFHGHDLMTTSKRLACIKQKKNQRQPFSGIPLKTIWAFWFIQSVLTFTKFAKFLKRSVVVASSNVFFYFLPAWKYA